MQGQTTLMWALLPLASLCLAFGTSDIASPVASLQEITSALMELKRDNSDLRRRLTERESLRSTSGGGATYIRWGRTSCPAQSELVYKGYVGGGHYSHDGAGTNHLCLPEQPQYTTSVQPSFYAALYGTEYEHANQIFQNQDHDMPCAVCRSSTRSSAIMIPARISCYPGFRHEYDGYLMGGYFGYKKGSEYICVDQNPENVVGGQYNHNGNLLYFTRGFCGSLKCPPYKDGWVITCVVCTK